MKQKTSSALIQNTSQPSFMQLNIHLFRIPTSETMSTQ